MANPLTATGPLPHTPDVIPLRRAAALTAGAVAVIAGVATLPAAGVHAVADWADPAVLVPVFWAAGAVAYLYRPQQPCARLLFGAGTLIAISHALATLPAAVAHGGQLWPVNLASQVTFLVGFALWGAALAVFPDGRVESRAERLVVRALPLVACAAAGFGFFGSPAPELIGAVARPATPVPFSWSGLAPVHAAAAALFAAPLLGVVLLVLRLRRSDPARRRPIRWPLTAAALAAVSIVASSLLEGLLGPTVQAYVFVVVVATLPVSLVVGMVRDGLFDLDRFVLRSLVFALLWAVIALAVAGVALLLGVEAGHQVAVAPAIGVALAAAMLFQPARVRLERWADRRVYGERLSALDAMRRLGSAMEQTGSGEDAGAAVAAALRRGLQCAWVRVRLHSLDGLDRLDTGAEAGVPAAASELAAPEIVEPIRYAGQVIGTIECGRPRRAGEQERALVADLARQVAPALHNAYLSRTLEARLAELTASRARLVQAEETERRRIERDLHDGIQAQLVAVAAKVDLARVQMGIRPAQVAATLDELAAAVRAAHVDLRELVRGIHPAVLGDHGLVRAIEDRTAALPLRVVVQADEHSRRHRLPLHVEGAAYFVAIEGITNVVRHARVDEALVAVSRHARELRVEVVDDGRGFAPGDVPSSGLRGLSDRLQALGGRLVVRSEPGAGTRLTGVLPIAATTDA